MNELAQVHFRQGQAFLLAGDAVRAIALLEKARVLAREDVALEAKVLEVLANAYDSAGEYEMSSRRRAQLDRLPKLQARPLRQQNPQMQATAFAPREIGDLPSASIAAVHGTRWGIVGAILAGIVVAVALFWPGTDSSDPAVPIATTLPTPVAASSATTAPTAFVPIVVPPIANPPVAALPSTPTTSPTASAASPDSSSSLFSDTSAASLSAPIADDRAALLKETVGLLMVQLQYEGVVDGRPMRVDVPLGTGSAFAVHPDGVLLTNRHVVAIDPQTPPPPTLTDLGLPTMTLRRQAMIVCFGAEAQQHFDAQLLHASSSYDLAILKIDRPGARSLKLATVPARLGEDVFACGFPGLVQMAMDKRASTPQRVAEVVERWRKNGHFDPLDELSRESFNSTLTRGIVAAAERNIDNVGYLQTDAAISPGNSGGPLLNTRDEVVGMVTMGIFDGPGNYNFALLLGQLREEIESFLNPK